MTLMSMYSLTQTASSQVSAPAMSGCAVHLHMAECDYRFAIHYSRLNAGLINILKI